MNENTFAEFMQAMLGMQMMQAMLPMMQNTLSGSSSNAASIVPPLLEIQTANTLGTSLATVEQDFDSDVTTLEQLTFGTTPSGAEVEAFRDAVVAAVQHASTFSRNVSDYAFATKQNAQTDGMIAAGGNSNLALAFVLV